MLPVSWDARNYIELPAASEIRTMKKLLFLVVLPLTIFACAGTERASMPGQEAVVVPRTEKIPIN